ncbi:MAG: hypothetical protein IJ464_02660 [Alistipes sp.]|nr:hypothetical protein [Alistipes sp.]
MKRTILLIGLGVAFLAVSLWVSLSGGRSAKAVRAKFRLGGAILSIVGITTFTGCATCYDQGGEQVSCYAPAPPPTNSLIDVGVDAGTSLRNGDIVVVDLYCVFESSVRIVLSDEADNELMCKVEPLLVGDNLIKCVIEAGDYVGKATLTVSYQIERDNPDTIDEIVIPISIIE